MSTDTIAVSGEDLRDPAVWAAIADAQLGRAAAEAGDLRFGPAPGNTMSPPWAAYAIGLWHQAGQGKLTFADAMKLTVVHFTVDGNES